MMKTVVYNHLDEAVDIYTLPNGLKVILIPKQDYHKTFAIFTTQYGSIDNTFIPLKQTEYVTVPDGIAHFLEHKMFEKEEGDVFQIFSEQGASANAFTSFTQTSYLFSSHFHIEDNLTTLLDFVQTPYFSKESVQKEKGIIEQEIQMYRDNPDWRLFFNLLGNLYPNHPVHIDIAGTVDSIQEITPELLYLCYETFYHPSNMSLVLVGNFASDQIISLIQNNQEEKNFAPPQKIERSYPKRDNASIKTYSEMKMPIAQPKCMVGFRGMQMLSSDMKERLRYKYALSIVMSMLFGETSTLYNQWYQDGLIDDSFDYELILEEDYYYGVWNTDTSRPQEFQENMIQVMQHFQQQEDFTQERFNLIKRQFLGKYVQSLNFLETIAQQTARLSFYDLTIFDLYELIDQLTFDEVTQRTHKALTDALFSTTVLWTEETYDG